MGAVAVFDPVAWAARYPEFPTVTSAMATAYAQEATLYLASDGTGPVKNPAAQLTLINMLVAFIAARYAPTPGPNGTSQPASPLVGRISSASEGSVSVSTDMATGAAGSATAFFSQNKYGIDFLAATAPYRTMRYIPRVRVADCNSGFAPWFR